MSYTICCPYCFKTFCDDEVHFRMETEFDESELNDEGLSEIELAKLPASSRKNELMKQTEIRKLFLRKDDERYNHFWERYGTTTEKSLGLDEQWKGEVYQLPILNPNLIDDQKGLIKQNNEENVKNPYLIYDNDGMVSSIEDVFHHTTRKRVCPHCHNPLPLQYGKHPVSFISVIGVTGAGKTVYISQLLKHISEYAPFINQAALFNSDHETNFIEDNKVEMYEDLPNSTSEGTFSQPMFYTFLTKENETIISRTIVIYDIAGEDCQDATKMARFADYINYSDGIILLIDPLQLGWINNSDQSDNFRYTIQAPQAVLTTIYNATTRAITELSNKPIAVCISKSDAFVDIIPEAINDIEGVRDQITGEYCSKFNASKYNLLEEQLKKAIPDELKITLSTQYKYYNYFAVSAIGGPVKEEPVFDKSGNPVMLDNGRPKMRSYPVIPPSPIRIAEPLFWIFYRLGFISANEPILLPKAREAPEYIEIPSKGVFRKFVKPKKRPLTEKEKKSYKYEPGCKAEGY